MRIVREIAPLALVTAIVLAVTTWLLAENARLGRWAMAAILFAHAWVHLMFVFPVPAPPPRAATAGVTAGGSLSPGAGPSGAPNWPFDLDHSWLITRAGVGAGIVLPLGRLLVVVVFVASVLATLATVPLLVDATWWSGLVIAAAAGSLALLVLLFAGTLVIGIPIGAWLLWIGLAGPWSPLG